MWLALRCAGSAEVPQCQILTPSSGRVQGRTERMSANGRYAVEATLARMFCPPLKQGRGKGWSLCGPLAGHCGVLSYPRAQATAVHAHGRIPGEIKRGETCAW